MQQIKHFTDMNDSIYASVSINTETGLLLNMWRGEVLQTGQISEVIQYCCEQTTKHKVKSWISDMTGLDGQFQEFSAEAQKNVLESVGRIGLQNFALGSQRQANPARCALLHTLTQLKIDVRTFDSFSQAIEWLLLPSMEDDVWEKAEACVY